MKNLDPILLKIFLYGLPLLAVLAMFSYLYQAGVVQHGNDLVRFLNISAGLFFAIWMTLSIYLSLRLIISGPLREQVLARLTFIRERDEREAMLTGKATKTAFLTSLALLILLFCLSCFQISIYRVPSEKAVDGKTGIVSLGLGFAFLEQGKQEHPEDTVERKDLFTYRGLPLSSTAIILLLIVWQIASYNCAIRRLMK